MEAVCSSARLEAAERWFAENFRERGEIGAALSVWRHGSEVLSLAGGTMTREGREPFTTETLVPVWSATKGMAAWACVKALSGAGVALDRPVTDVWPDFEQAGKGEMTFRQMLGHAGGLAVLDAKVSVLDHAAVVRALEKQTPLAAPGTGQGYHARTFGFLLDEVTRRVSGARSLAEYFETKLRAPLAAEFWLGLPESEDRRVATLYPGRMTEAYRDDAFLRAFQTPGTITQRAFQSPSGLGAVADFNRPDTWRLGLASMGGVGSARGLARLYAHLIEGDVVEELTRVASDKEDVVLCRRAAFGSGVMKDPVDPQSGRKWSTLFGPSTRAFGHPGAGGSLAFADPENGIAFAYVMNQMELGVLPGEKALGLVRALHGLG